MDNQLFIKAKNISKEYHSKNNKQVIPVFSRKNNTQVFKALDNVSFEIFEGERVGLIGSNGAGKTTLLNIISNFSTATSGSIDVHGEVNPIMDIGGSVQPELTGLENIYVAGDMYGKSKQEISDMIPELLEFIDIGDYINRPVKSYSSGMRAKLSFSLISFIQPEILIIDEVLGVGDINFYKKSSQKIQELCQKGKILLVVSHSMQTIKDFSDRCIWMDHGKIRMDGPTESVTKAYIEWSNEKMEAKMRTDLIEQYKTVSTKTGDIIMENIQLLHNSKDCLIHEVFNDIQIQVFLDVKNNYDHIDCIFTIYNMYDYILWENSYFEDTGKFLSLYKGKKLKIQTELKHCPLSEGNYELECQLIHNGKELLKKNQLFHITNNVISYRSKPEVFCEYAIEHTFLE